MKKHITPSKERHEIIEHSINMIHSTKEWNEDFEELSTEELSCVLQSIEREYEKLTWELYEIAQIRSTLQSNLERRNRF